MIEPRLPQTVQVIAAGTRHLLLQHMPKGAKLRLADVLELFKLMR